MYTYQPSQQLDNQTIESDNRTQNVSSNEHRFDNLRSSVPKQDALDRTNPAEIYPNIHFEEVQSSEFGAKRVSPKGLADVKKVEEFPMTATSPERSSNAGSKWWDKKPFASPPPQQRQDTDLESHTDHAELEPEQDANEPQFHHEPQKQWWQDKPFGPTSPSPASMALSAPSASAAASAPTTNNVSPKQVPLPDANYKNNGIEVRMSGFTPLLGLTFVGNPPPAPPIVMDATPDVWYSEFQAKREIEAVAEEEERIRSLKQKKEETKGGLGYKMGKFFSNTSAAVSKGVTGVADSHEAKVRENNIKQAKARLAKYWPSHKADNFIVEFDAHGLHKNIPVRGHIILTQTSLLFLGKGKNDLVIVDEILLADIISYTKAVALHCVDKEARWVITLPNSFVQADAVQIFTNNGIKLDFINISQSILKSASALPGSHISDGHDDVLAYDRFINYFDHAWRAQARR